MLDDAPVCRQDGKNHLYRSVSLAGKDFHTIDNTRLIYKSYHLFSTLPVIEPAAGQGTS